MSDIRRLRRLKGLKQAELAQAGGTSQPAIAAYETGRKSPTLATVRRLAASVGLEATVHFSPPMTREERRSLHLHRAIAERLISEPDRIIGQARRNLQRMRAGASEAPQPLREWGLLLDRPAEALAEVLIDPSPWARELRHVTPFAGVLTAGARAEVYREFAAEEARHR